MGFCHNDINRVKLLIVIKKFVKYRGQLFGTDFWEITVAHEDGIQYLKM